MTEKGEEKVEEKKWSDWTVVWSEGRYQCKRESIGGDADSQYDSSFEPPVFSRDELRAMVNFGTYGILTPDQIAGTAFDNRIRRNAFRRCDELNGVTE